MKHEYEISGFISFIIINTPLVNRNDLEACVLGFISLRDVSKILKISLKPS